MIYESGNSFPCQKWLKTHGRLKVPPSPQPPSQQSSGTEKEQGSVHASRAVWKRPTPSGKPLLEKHLRSSEKLPWRLKAQLTPGDWPRASLVSGLPAVRVGSRKLNGPSMQPRAQHDLFALALILQLRRFPSVVLGSEPWGFVPVKKQTLSHRTKAPVELFC